MNSRFVIGDRVFVKKLFSAGIIEDVETSIYDTKDEFCGRYGIKLDNNPFPFSPAYFRPCEVEILK